MSIKLKELSDCYFDGEEFISVCGHCGGMITYPSFNHYKAKAFSFISSASHICDIKIYSGKENLSIDYYDDYYSGYGYYDYCRYVYDHIIGN